MFLSRFEEIVSFCEENWSILGQKILSEMEKPQRVDGKIVGLHLFPPVREWGAREVLETIRGKLLEYEDCKLEVLKRVADFVCEEFEKCGFEVEKGDIMPNTNTKQNQKQLFDFSTFSGEGGFERYLQILEEDGEAKMLEKLAIDIADETGQVTADDLRVYVEEYGIEVKKSYKVFGAVLMNLKRRGVLKIAGYTKSKIPTNHGRPIAVYVPV